MWEMCDKLIQCVQGNHFAAEVVAGQNWTVTQSAQIGLAMTYRSEQVSRVSGNCQGQPIGGLAHLKNNRACFDGYNRKNL